MAGMPGPIFIIFVPHKKLAEIDLATGSMAAIEKAMNEETMIFAMSPELSYPVPELVAQDPAFWNRKPAKPGS